jgi:hypothetical protein
MDFITFQKVEIRQFPTGGFVGSSTGTSVESTTSTRSTNTANKTSAGESSSIGGLGGGGGGGGETVVSSTTLGGTVIYKTVVETHYVTDAPGIHNGSLSSGDIAGIAVGAVGAAILSVVLAFWLFRRRRKTKQSARAEDKHHTEPQELAAGEENVGGTGHSELHDKSMLFEARDGERFELPIPTAELEGNRMSLKKKRQSKVLQPEESSNFSQE